MAKKIIDTSAYGGRVHTQAPIGGGASMVAPSLAAGSGNVAATKKPNLAASFRLPTAKEEPDPARRLDLAKAKATLLGVRMGFTPVNLEVYVTSFSGAVSGMLGGRLIQNTIGPDFLSLVIAASVYAQEFDRIYNQNDRTITELEAEMIFLLSASNFNGRQNFDLNATDYDAIINPVITQMNDALTYLEGIGVTPLPWGGGVT